MSELTRALRKLKAGETTTISVYRGGSQVHMNITLDEKPQENQPTEPETQNPSDTQGNGYNDWFGSFFPGLG